jgi:hypothetical protein
MVTVAPVRDPHVDELAAQVGSFLLHILLSLVALALVFGVISVSGTSHVPAAVTTVLAFVVPGIVAYLIHLRIRFSVARILWIAGMVWLFAVLLYVLQMPTAPGACLHCTGPQKIWLTLFSMSSDSNLLGGAGRFIGTWPALAMIGYSFGARIALRRRGL